MTGYQQLAPARGGLPRFGKRSKNSAGRPVDVHLEFQWGIGDADCIQWIVADLLGRSPDVIVANGGPAVKAGRKATSTVPIIFIRGTNPVAEGLVRSLANRGGNLTGFTVLESSLRAKLLDPPQTGRTARAPCLGSLRLVRIGAEP
jgi:hypothetical protein